MISFKPPFEGLFLVVSLERNLNASKVFFLVGTSSSELDVGRIQPSLLAPRQHVPTQQSYIPLSEASGCHQRCGSLFKSSFSQGHGLAR